MVEQQENQLQWPDKAVRKALRTIHLVRQM
jgi:hypothetical protein